MKRSFKEKILSNKISILVLFILLSVLIFCFVVPTAYFASTAVNMEGGSNIYYTEYVAPTKPDINDPNAGKEESDKINNDLGLSTTPDPDGGFVLGDSTQNGGIPIESVTDKRENWINNGILSYVRYEGAICSVSRSLIVVLDFSKYYVTKFEQNCFDGLLHIFFGYKGITAEESLVFEQDIIVYDSKSGDFLKKEKVLLDGTGNWSRYDEQTGEYIQGEAMDITFRIVLPSLQDDDIVQFGQNSLVFATTANTISSKLVSMEIDLSYVDVRNAAGELRVFINKQALGNSNGKPGKTNHVHFIGYTAEQLEYALRYTIEYTNSLKSEGCITELFVKPNMANDFSRIYFSCEKGKGNVTIPAIYDSVHYDTTQKSDTTSILALAHWLKYSYNAGLANSETPVSAFRHYYRTANNELEEQFGNVTFGTTLADGRTQVACTHNMVGGKAEVIGYFDKNRNFYDKDGNLLEGLKVLNATCFSTLNCDRR